MINHDVNEEDVLLLAFLCNRFKYCTHIKDIIFFYSVLREIDDFNYNKLVEEGVFDSRVKKAIEPLLKEMEKAEYDNDIEDL